MPNLMHQATPAALLTRPETDYPIGSVAHLLAPFPADRGLWVEPRLVDRFVKTPNGRWTSYPGNDVNYPTLNALALAAPVASVQLPGIMHGIMPAPDFGLLDDPTIWDGPVDPGLTNLVDPTIWDDVPDAAPGPIYTTTTTPAPKKAGLPGWAIAGIAVTLGWFFLAGSNRRKR